MTPEREAEIRHWLDEYGWSFGTVLTTKWLSDCIAEIDRLRVGLNVVAVALDKEQLHESAQLVRELAKGAKNDEPQ